MVLFSLSSVYLNVTLQRMPRNVDMERLFRLHYRPLCLYVLHFTADLQASEDIVQDCFVSMMGKTVTNPKAYLYAAARNKSLDWFRAQKPSFPLPEDLPETEAMEQSEREARLWAAVERLPRQRRQCLLLAKRDGLSYEEIGRRLGLSRNTVRNHIARALQSLRAGETASQNLSILLLF